jgi:hypothetical protein
MLYDYYNQQLSASKDHSASSSYNLPKLQLPSTATSTPFKSTTASTTSGFSLPKVMPTYSPYKKVTQSQEDEDCWVRMHRDRLEN